MVSAWWPLLMVWTADGLKNHNSFYWWPLVVGKSGNPCNGTSYFHFYNLFYLPILFNSSTTGHDLLCVSFEPQKKEGWHQTGNSPCQVYLRKIMLSLPKLDIYVSTKFWWDTTQSLNRLFISLQKRQAKPDYWIEVIFRWPIGQLCRGRPAHYLNISWLTGYRIRLINLLDPPVPSVGRYFTGQDHNWPYQSDAFPYKHQGALFLVKPEMAFLSLVHCFHINQTPFHTNIKGQCFLSNQKWCSYHRFLTQIVLQ